MLLPYRLDLLLAAAIKLIEDVDEQVREYLQNLAWRVKVVMIYLAFMIVAKDGHCLPAFNRCSDR